MNIINDMRHQAKACNKFLTEEYMDNMSPIQLLGHTHPFDRESNLSALAKGKVITSDEKKQYTQQTNRKKLKETRQREPRAYPHDLKRRRRK